MRVAHVGYHIEVWGMDYINNPSKRNIRDQSKKVLQAEHIPGGDNFLVEVEDND